MNVNLFSVEILHDFCIILFLYPFHKRMSMSQMVSIFILMLHTMEFYICLCKVPPPHPPPPPPLLLILNSSSVAHWFIMSALSIKYEGSGVWSVCVCVCVCVCVYVYVCVCVCVVGMGGGGGGGGIVMYWVLVVLFL